jgi:hypothetical protein
MAAADALTWVSLGESFMESTLADQVLTDGAPVDRVLGDGALSGGVLGNGMLTGNALVQTRTKADAAPESSGAGRKGIACPCYRTNVLCQEDGAVR